MKLVAEQLGNNITSIAVHESAFAEGDKGELAVYLSRPLTQDDIFSLEQNILSQGVVLTEPIAQDSGILVIKFQKAMAPLLIIGIAVAAVAISVSGVLGWQIFKLTPEQASVQLWSILGLAFAYWLFKNKAKGWFK